MLKMFKVAILLLLLSYLTSSVHSTIWMGARIADPDTSCIEDPAFIKVSRAPTCYANETICGDPKLGTMINNVCLDDPWSFAQHLANKWATPYAVRKVYFAKSGCEDIGIHYVEIMKMDNRCHVSTSADYLILANSSLLTIHHHVLSHCDPRNVTGTTIYDANRCVSGQNDDSYMLSYVYPGHPSGTTVTPVMTEHPPEPTWWYPDPYPSIPPKYPPQPTWWYPDPYPSSPPKYPPQPTWWNPFPFPSPAPTDSPEFPHPSPLMTFIDLFFSFIGLFFSIFTSRIEFVIPVVILVVVFVVANELTTTDEEQQEDPNESTRLLEAA